MALPKQLKSARMSNATTGSDIDNKIGDLELALADILGITADVDVTASAFALDNSGRITTALVEQRAAGPVGWRFRDSAAGKEVRLAISGTNFVIDENTGTEGVPIWTNRFTMAISTGAMTGALATASRMGLCPQGDGNSAHFLDGTLSWSTPSGSAVPACRVRNSSSISIPNNTFTQLTFNTEDFDTDTMHSTVTNTGRITATTLGKYLIVGNVLWAANIAGLRQLRIRANASVVHAQTTVDALSAAAAQGQQVVALVSLAAGDYVALEALQNTGSSINVTAAANYSPSFAAYKVG